METRAADGVQTPNEPDSSRHRITRLVDRVSRRLDPRLRIAVLQLRALLITAAWFVVVDGATHAEEFWLPYRIVPRDVLIPLGWGAVAALLGLAALIAGRVPAFSATLLLAACFAELSGRLHVPLADTGVLHAGVLLFTILACRVSSSTMALAATRRALDQGDRDASLDHYVLWFRNRRDRIRRSLLVIGLALVTFAAFDAWWFLNSDSRLRFHHGAVVYSLGVSVLCALLAFVSDSDELPNLLPKRRRALTWLSVGLGLVAVHFANHAYHDAAFIKRPLDAVRIATEVPGASPVDPILHALVAIVVAPLGEELIFRGFLWAALLRLGLSRSQVFFAVALHFVAIHASGPIASYASELVHYVPMAVLFCALRAATNSLLPSIVAHVAWNAAIVLFPEPTSYS